MCSPYCVAQLIVPVIAGVYPAVPVLPAGYPVEFLFSADMHIWCLAHFQD